MGRVRVLDPRCCPAWDEFVARQPEATVFHSGPWAQALTTAYGFQPRYYVLETGSGEMVAALPLMLVRSLLTGHRLVGLPFSDLCPPLAAGPAALAPLAAAVAEDVRRQGVGHVELRGGHPHWLGPLGFATAGHPFVRHVLELPATAGELERLVHPSARRGVRKALRLGVRVRRAGAEALPLFYRIYQETRQRQHLAPAPYRFFAAIGQHLLERGLGCLLLAEVEGQAVACNLLLWWRDWMVYKANVSLPQWLEARPNNLLLWHSLGLAQEMGLRRLDLGRSDAAQAGLRRFKSLWGAVEAPLPYFYYPAPAAAGRRRALGGALRLLARASPRWGSRALGSLLYRHLA
jgi:CelD/BcsL family acetyltransferase involved in cellulose biosynthesis